MNVHQRIPGIYQWLDDDRRLLQPIMRFKDDKFNSAYANFLRDVKPVQYLIYISNATKKDSFR